jgi:hypothetical protein
MYHLSLCSSCAKRRGATQIEGWDDLVKAFNNTSRRGWSRGSGSEDLNGIRNFDVQASYSIKQRFYFILKKIIHYFNRT